MFGDNFAREICFSSFVLDMRLSNCAFEFCFCFLLCNSALEFCFRILLFNSAFEFCFAILLVYFCFACSEVDSGVIDIPVVTYLFATFFFACGLSRGFCGFICIDTVVAWHPSRADTAV